MTAPTYTALPTAPDRGEPATFASRANTFVDALPTFGTEMHAIGVFSEEKAVEAATSATTATTKATEAAASASTVAAYTADIHDLGFMRIWSNGLLAAADIFGGIHYQRPTPDIWDGTSADLLRYHDADNLSPAPNSEVAAFNNSSVNWTVPSAFSGVRLPVAAWTGTKAVAVCQGFLSGTTDTSPSAIAFTTITVVGDTITPGTTTLLVDDSTAVNKLANPTLVHNPVLGLTFCLFSRDDRDGSTTELFELATDDEGATWTAGDGGAAFTIGGDDSGARSIAGVLDGAVDRTYFSPNPGHCDADGTMFVCMWEDTDTGGGSTYRMVVLKRTAAESEWSRLWSTTGAGVTGEASVVELASGNLLIVDRPTSGATGRSWHEITKLGASVDSGVFTELSTVQIGSGVCRLDSNRILWIGPEEAVSTGQRDIGMHAAVTYDAVPEDMAWYVGPEWDDPWAVRHVSLSGVALATPILADTYSGNSSLCPLGDGRALALIERRGPTNGGTAGDYIAVGCRLLNATNALRNAEAWEIYE